MALRDAQRSRWRPLLLLFLAGPVLAGLTYHFSRRHADAQTAGALERVVQERSERLTASLETHLDALRALGLLFDSSEVVTREEFRAYAAAQRARFPAIRCFGWVPNGATAAVLYTEPASAGDLTIGPDLAIDPLTRPALLRAAASGEPAMTDPLPGASPQDGATVLVFQAVYAKGATPARRRLLGVRGFVLLSVTVADLARLSAFGADPQSPPLDWQLTDVEVQGRPVVMAGAEPPPARGGADPPRAARTIRIAGQQWQLSGDQTAAFAHAHATTQPIANAAGVFVVAELAAALALVLGIRARERIEAGYYRLTDSVLRSLKDGVLVGDREGRVRLVNDSARRLLGVDSSDGRSAAAPATVLAARGFYRPDRTTPYPAHDLPITRALRGEAVAETDVYVSGDNGGAAAWLTVSGAPLADEAGALDGGVAVLHDVTESRRSQAVVSLLFNAVEHTSDTVFITDREGRIEFVNAAFEATTGYTRDEAIGSTPRLLRSGAQSPEYYQRLWATILSGQVFRDVVVNRAKGGRLWYADQTITPMRDAAGAVTHFVSVLKDMTEQRRRQEQEIEMELAARIQRRLYPEEPPRIPGCDIHGAAFPAGATCGDYYDFIPMTAGHVGLVIGDVSGHGFGPALVMAETRALLRAYCRDDDDVGRVMTAMNRNLEADLERDQFVTLLFAAIDPAARSLVYVNAGHPPGWILDAGGEVKATLRSCCLPLGMMPDNAYASSKPIPLASGDLIVLVTDGVTEVGPEESDSIEEGRVLDAIRGCRHLPAREMVDCLYEAARAFAEGRPQDDDIAVVVCKIA